MPPELLLAIEALQTLPGMGRRSAMRIAFDFIRKGVNPTKNFCNALTALVEHVCACEHCGAYKTQGQPCSFCDNPKRETKSLCIVENPSDIFAVENTGEFRGLYHVLGGVLSPLDGMGPEELKIPQLKARAQELQIEEVIVAANPSVEGNATGHYIAEMLKPLGIKVTRIATGLALGQALDYAETQAISQSLRLRVTL